VESTSLSQSHKKDSRLLRASRVGDVAFRSKQWGRTPFLAASSVIAFVTAQAMAAACIESRMFQELLLSKHELINR
jgi:hypothetical protein